MVDEVIDAGDMFVLLPSRRQVDFDGGYVNHWTTEALSSYVEGRIKIQRDHGGAGQGRKIDDGLESYTADATYCDLIHVDPWLVCQTYDDGLEMTIRDVNHICSLDGDAAIEVGTEESIRSFDANELRRFLTDLKDRLPAESFDRIEYVVVQSGVGLDTGRQVNIGTFSSLRLRGMIEVCREFDKKSKEHNGDYLSVSEYRTRFGLGLDAINIAPEFGQIETMCYMDAMSEEELEEYYRICRESGKWEKWVGPEFVPDDNRKTLILICGHYVLSDDDFLAIRPEIDKVIRGRLRNKIEELRGAL